MSLLVTLMLASIVPKAGTSGFDFLNIDPSAREAAIAGSVTSFGGGAMSFWYNPAHLAEIENPECQVGYANYIAGIHLGSLAYSRPLSADLALGTGIVYLNSGQMKRTDPEGHELGTFGASFADIDIAGAFRATSDLVFGLGLRGLYGSIDTFFALGIAGNLGVNYRLEGLSCGFSASNLGTQLKAFRDGVDPLPMEFALGFCYRPNPAVGLSLSGRKPVSNRFNIRGGIEGWVSDHLVLRAGYSSLGSDLVGSTGVDALAGFAAGFGIRVRSYQLDYCFVPMAQLGLAHRLALSFAL
ncbi:MAG: PorV/PorQ family protein [candidate division WOR-3 bacterium]